MAIHSKSFAFCFPPLSDFLTGYSICQEILNIYVITNLRILGGPRGFEHCISTFAPFVEIVKGSYVFNIQQTVYRANSATAFNLCFLCLQAIVYGLCLCLNSLVSAFSKQLVHCADRVLYCCHGGPHGV